MSKQKHRRLTKTGKIIVAVGCVVAIALVGGIGYGIYSWLKPSSETPVATVTPSPTPSSDPSLASVYDPIYTQYHDLNNDYVAYLEWENGATGVFTASTGEAPGVNRLEIAMDNGLIICQPDGSDARTETTCPCASTPMLGHCTPGPVRT